MSVRIRTYDLPLKLKLEGLLCDGELLVSRSHDVDCTLTDLKSHFVDSTYVHNLTFKQMKSAIPDTDIAKDFS